MRLVILLPFVAFLLGCRLTSPEDPLGDPWLLVPDVGQGHGVAVVRGSRAVVVDAGPPDQSALDRALREAGVEEIEVLVLTHPDLDHAGGLDSLTLPVRRIVHGALSESDSARILGRCRFLPEGCLHAAVSDSLAVLSGLGLRVLGPAGRSLHDETNANSLVVEFRRGGHGLFLASGDLDTLGELAILDRLEPVDVVQLGHHGSAGSNHLRWLGALSPRVAIVQAGAGNPYGHPAPSTLARVLAVGAHLAAPDGSPLRVDF